jgi:hypothetical protein
VRINYDNNNNNNNNIIIIIIIQVINSTKARARRAGTRAALMTREMSEFLDMSDLLNRSKRVSS